MAYDPNDSRNPKNKKKKTPDRSTSKILDDDGDDGVLGDGGSDSGLGGGSDSSPIFKSSVGCGDGGCSGCE